MCVNTATEPWNCCCGCMSLTQGTILIGVLYLLGTIATAIAGQWASFAFYLVLTCLFGLVVVKPYNADVRKIIYYIYFVLLILGLIGMVIFFIYAFASDFEETWCSVGGNYSGNYQDCVDWINLFLIIYMVIVILAIVPCSLLILQVLFYGWKEQEKINQERQTHDSHVPAGPGNAYQQVNTGYGPGQTMQ